MQTLGITPRHHVVARPSRQALRRIGLACLALLAGCNAPSPTAEPLNPYDNMSYWKAADEAQKLPTARKLIAALTADGSITVATDRETLAAELAAELDQATDADTKAYVSPGQSMLYTAQQIAAQKKWN